MEDTVQQWDVLRQCELKKTRKGWIGNKIKELHLRDDVPCGFELCSEHASARVFPQDLFAQEEFFLIDTYTLIHQTDIIYNCDEIKNIIILQSSIEKLRAYNPVSDKLKKQKYPPLKVETQASTSTMHSRISQRVLSFPPRGTSSSCLIIITRAYEDTCSSRPKCR